MNEFKLIVAGGRDFKDEERMITTLNGLADVEFADKSLSIVSGMAKGADLLAWNFAQEFDIERYAFRANWDDLTAPGAVIKQSRWGYEYNANAGFDRNHAMGDYADGLLAFWDGQSSGTKDMIDYMRGLKKYVHVVSY